MVSLNFPGKVVYSQKDILDWVADTEQFIDETGAVTATFVINIHNSLLISDRHDEHVACAGGENVLSAGEITFIINEKDVEVAEITNQSTGYCPEPASWGAVKEALSKIDIISPSSFTSEFIFRKCIKCSSINIVKEDYFYCAVCNGELPKDYNVN